MPWKKITAIISNLVNFILVYLVIKLQLTYTFYTYKETSQAAAVPTAAGSTAKTVHGLEVKPTDSADSENKIQVCFIRWYSVEAKVYDFFNNLNWKIKWRKRKIIFTKFTFEVINANLF